MSAAYFYVILGSIVEVLRILSDAHYTKGKTPYEWFLRAKVENVMLAKEVK